VEKYCFVYISTQNISEIRAISDAKNCILCKYEIVWVLQQQTQEKPVARFNAMNLPFLCHCYLILICLFRLYHASGHQEEVNIINIENALKAAAGVYKDPNKAPHFQKTVLVTAWYISTQVVLSV
jgi:hypothetical protein